MDKGYKQRVSGSADVKTSFWSRRKRKQKQAQKDKHIPHVAGESHSRNRSATIEAFSNGELDLKGLLDKNKTALKPKESCNQSSRLLPDLAASLKNSICLAYFLEFLQFDNARNLLDFWLSVEAFKAVTNQRIRRKTRGKSQSNDLATSSASDLEAEKTCAELDRLCLSNGIVKSNQTIGQRGVFENDCLQRVTGDHVTELKFSNDWHPFSQVTTEASPSADASSAEEETQNRRASRTKSFLGDAMNIYEQYLSLDALCPVRLPCGLRQTVEGNMCQDPNSIDPECFCEAQVFVFSELEKYHLKFLSSCLGRKYQLSVISSTKLSLQDIVYDSMGIFYFTEFMELEHSGSILEFWLTAENFERQLESRIKGNCYDVDECLEDAMTIYDKYFSMRSPSRLIFDDKLRIVLENNICRADGPQPNCFCIPMAYAWTVLKEVYFPRFLLSDMYSRYTNDLQRSSEDQTTDEDSLTSSEARSTSNATIAESSSEWDLLDMDSEAIWQRPGTGRLALGHVDRFGNFHSESEPEPDRKGSRRQGGSKFRSAIKKFIANESASDVDEEQLAMERAQKIIEDVQKLNSLS